MMTTVQELRAKYQQLVKSPPSSYNEEGEAISLLYQTKWLRILLIRRAKTPSTVIVEVEVWIPKSVSDRSYESEEGSSSTITNEGKTQILLSSVIDHLEYLQRLQTVGFTLQRIEEECLWSASQSFTREPRKEVLEFLVPP